LKGTHFRKEPKKRTAWLLTKGEQIPKEKKEFISKVKRKKFHYNVGGGGENQSRGGARVLVFGKKKDRGILNLRGPSMGSHSKTGGNARARGKKGV